MIATITESSANNSSSHTKAKQIRKSDNKTKTENAKPKAMEEASVSSTKVIPEPHAHDILSGRGATINQHPGNEYYRQLIKSQKLNYIQSSPSAKKNIIRGIVLAVTKLQSPPGRFLKRNGDNGGGAYEDIGIEEAKKKTGQALREDAPKIRKMNVISQYLNSDAASACVASASASASRHGGRNDVNAAGNNFDAVQKAAVASALHLIQKNQQVPGRGRVQRSVSTLNDMERAVDEIKRYNKGRTLESAILMRENRSVTPPEYPYPSSLSHSSSSTLRPTMISPTASPEEHVNHFYSRENNRASSGPRSMSPTAASNPAYVPMPPLFEATSANYDDYMPQTNRAGGTGYIGTYPSHEYEYSQSVDPTSASMEMDPISMLQHSHSQLNQSQFYNPVDRTRTTRTMPFNINTPMNSYPGHGLALQRQQQQQQQRSNASTFDPRDMTDAEVLHLAFASMPKDSISRLPAILESMRGTKRRMDTETRDAASESSAFYDYRHMNSSRKRMRG